MCAGVYLCACMYVAHMQEYICMHICRETHECVHMCIYIARHVFTYAWIEGFGKNCMNICMYLYDVHMYACTYM